MVTEKLYCLAVLVVLFLLSGMERSLCNSKGAFLKFLSGIFAMSDKCFCKDVYVKDCRMIIIRLFLYSFWFFLLLALLKLLSCCLDLQKSCRFLTNSL